MAFEQVGGVDYLVRLAHAGADMKVAGSCRFECGAGNGRRRGGLLLLFFPTFLTDLLLHLL
jgi:hypothetical protein